MNNYKKYVIAIVVLFLVAEIASYTVCKLFLHDLFRLRTQNYKEDIESFIKEGSYEKELGWTKIPLSSENYAEWSYHIDEDGSRLNELFLDTVSMSVYGNSFTFCEDVNDDET